jgi:hypothetical protein
VSLGVSIGQVLMIRVGGSFGSQGIAELTVFNANATACDWMADECFGDFNNDGGVDGDDVIEFFLVWDAGRECADVTGDGSVDGDDVIVFFDAWDLGGFGSPGC